MSNQKGSAIVLVMMMMAVLALAAAGLLVQSRMDTKITRSMLSYDRTLNLADGLSRVSFEMVKIQTSDTFKYSGAQTRRFVAEAGGATTATGGTGGKGTYQRSQTGWDSSNIGYWDCYMVLGGYKKQAPPGWEIGSVQPAILDD